MNTASEPLPNDVATLRATLIEVRAERDAERAEKAQLAAACDQLASQNDRLRHLIRQLQRLQFGRRSEKLDPDQLSLALEDIEQAIAETEAEQEKADPALKRARAEKRRGGRGSLPEHLPRLEVVIEPENTACPCCGGAMQVIGEDRSSRLDMIPAQYRVLVTRRPKYACHNCQEGVMQAAAPARLIAGGLPTERLVAHVAVAKYADHCPLYRLVPVAPGRQARVDVVFVSVDQAVRGHGRRDHRLDRLLLHVGEHADRELTTALDQTEDRRLVLLQCAPSRRTRQPAASARPPLFATAAGWPLCPATT